MIFKLKVFVSILLLIIIFPATLLAQVDTAWTRRTNGRASALAVDGSGNVYVTGSSYGDTTQIDYLTIKYDGSGKELWASRYNGADNFFDQPFALTVDNYGNVYVAGWSDQIEYTENHKFIKTHVDYAIVKYDTHGNELWVRQYNGSADSNDYVYAIAVDSSGNSYVTGEGCDKETGYEFVTIKYDQDGNVLWVRDFNGRAYFKDGAIDIAVDNLGNAYVTGYSYAGRTYSDYATIKYDSTGKQLWVSFFNGPSNGEDWPRAIAIDHSGNVYITGVSKGKKTKHDFATVKYDANGNELWARFYNGPGNSYDEPRGIVVDDSGNVYVTGACGRRKRSIYSCDYVTIKYDRDGKELWIRRYNATGTGEDHASDLAIDEWGNVYVTGSSGIYPHYDYATIKYDSSGKKLWVRKYNGPGNDKDTPCAIAVDVSGNVYVTGQSDGADSFADFATIKYVQTDKPGSIPSKKK
jgi:hypothetical protein